MAIVVKVPGINGLGKTSGCEKAGDEIAKSLGEIYSNESRKVLESGEIDLREIRTDSSDAEKTNRLIYKNSLEIFRSGKKAIFLGGDHSVSFPLAKAFLDSCKERKKRPYLVVFDAHPDCMEPASVEVPTHEDWLRSLIESGFPPGNVMLVGARNSDEHEILFMAENRIKQISMNALLEDLEGSGDSITEFSGYPDAELYLSVDIDAADPAFAPGTGYLEPGGLTSRELIYLLQRMSKVRNLRALDIVEINPKKDKSGITVKLGAKILSEFI